ncbi:hypothetical protein GIB67_009973 [Kingdonia uniflora]|uniref:Uncharacterized protein n=1 Tax=Kingdonia uniflora TaxID=39325 RepID=A0A7J7L9A6_9MAGN|nr:hypothetical protein GIB67_009973 [Kingdonia uniflora]
MMWFLIPMSLEYCTKWNLKKNVRSNPTMLQKICEALDNYSVNDERDCDALIESKNQLEEELAMIKGSKATVEIFETEDMAEKLKDKERECNDLKKHVSELDQTRQEEREVLKEKLKILGKAAEDKPETATVVSNEVVKILAERNELKLELVKLKQLLAIKEAIEQLRNPTNDGVDVTSTLVSEH